MSTIDPSSAKTISPDVMDDITPYDQVESSASPLDHPFKFTIESYRRLAESGVLGRTAKVYLWKGQLVESMTKGDPHAFGVKRLYDRLTPIVPAGWYVDRERPMRIADDSLPEPDVTVIRGADRDHAQKTPTAQEVALIIEVADSSLAIDMGEVWRTYAAERIPIYWVVNLRARQIWVFGDPTGPVKRPTYRVGHQYEEGQEVPVVLDGREIGRIAVADVLP